MNSHGLIISGLGTLLLAACGGTQAVAEDNPFATVFATELVRFEPGPGAGYGQDGLPEVVLGPPMAQGPELGSTDVVSLGVGGSIVLALEDRLITNGPGADLIIFENAFWPAGDVSGVYAEPGQVSVSNDGEIWHTWPCDPEPADPGTYPGCAGWRPTLAFNPDHGAVTAETMGGDPFDLEVLGIETARFVRIDDLSAAGQAPSAGFDLDAVGAVSWRFAD